MNLKTIALAAGCFDGDLHPGHLNLLKTMREMSDFTVVLINCDEYVRDKKGPNRPIYKAQQRVSNLYVSGYVDMVIVFENNVRLLSHIQSIRPAFIFVGEDYTKETTVGWPECEAWGGEVIFAPKTHSTSEIYKAKES